MSDHKREICLNFGNKVKGSISKTANVMYKDKICIPPPEISIDIGRGIGDDLEGNISGDITEVGIVKYATSDFEKTTSEQSQTSKNCLDTKPIFAARKFESQIPKSIFCGRFLELLRLKDIIHTSSTSSIRKPNIAVVSGLGGIGKTELVKEFIRKNRTSYEEIIFIDAESSTSIKESFKSLATDTLKITITNVDGKEKNLEWIIERALDQLSKTKTLFVYDNVTNIKDIKFVFTKSAIGDNGHVIITSRLQEWGSKIENIWLKELESRKAIEYVSKMLNAPYDPYDDRKSLVEMLQALPLALLQAISYINQERAKQIYRISDYIEKCHTREMLDSQLFQDVKYYFYKNTTFTTWDSTIDEIARNKTSGLLAIKILNIIAYFDPEKIHRHIFLHLPSDGHIEITEENVISAVRLLVNYSMVNCQDYRSILSVHRLVQAVIKLKLEEINQEKQILRDALTLITKLIEEAPDKLTKANSHAMSVFISALKFEDLKKEFSSLPVKILNSLIGSRNYDRAEAFGRKVLQPMVDILGADCGHTIKQLLQSLPHSSYGQSSTIFAARKFESQIPKSIFCGRFLELLRLKDIIHTSSTSSIRKPNIAVVSGLGGIGKTELVKEFIRKNRTSYEEIIFIDAESSTSIKESFKSLATDTLKITITNVDGKEKNLEWIIERALDQLSKTKTLFVYDNVTNIKDIKFVFTKSAIGDNGHVIITSRLQEWGSKIENIWLKELESRKAIEYVSKMLNAPYDPYDDRKSLVEMLQALPLALLQAISYINQERAKQIYRISDYIEKCHTREMLDSQLFQDVKYYFYKNTTFTTWDSTIDEIARNKTSGLLAIKILNIIAYFDPEKIHRHIFLHLPSDGHIEITEENVISAVRLLVNYSMVNCQDYRSILSVHRLVQAVIKLKLEENNQEKQILRDALTLITKLIEEAPDKLTKANSHAMSVFISALKFEDLKKEFSSLPVKILNSLIGSRNYDRAEAFGRKVLQPMVDILGADCGHTIKQLLQSLPHSSYGQSSTSGLRTIGSLTLTPQLTDDQRIIYAHMGAVSIVTGVKGTITNKIIYKEDGIEKGSSHDYTDGKVITVNVGLVNDIKKCNELANDSNVTIVPKVNEID